MDITCGVLMSHSSSNTKLYIQLMSLLYDNLSMRKNIRLVQRLHDINNTSKIKTINDALNNTDIKPVLDIINKYAGITECDIDIIKMITNAKKNGIDKIDIMTDFDQFLPFILTSEEIKRTITISYNTDNEYGKDADELIEIFKYAMLDDTNIDDTDTKDKYSELYFDLTYAGEDIYYYHNLFEKYENMFTFNIHIENITNYTRAPIISYMLLSSGQLKDRSEYVSACHILQSIYSKPDKQISINLNMRPGINIMSLSSFSSSIPGIYAYRAESELFLDSLLNNSNTDDPGRSIADCTKTIEELDRIREDITELGKQNNWYAIIDYILTAVIGAEETVNDNKVTRLDMIYMIDEYPAGSELNPLLLETIKRFQSRAKDILRIEPNASIYHADENYKASIMRNVCLTKCETEYMIFKDDDDIGCSLIELCGMIEKELQKQKYPNDIGLLTLPAASVDTNAGALFAMWRFVYRPKILRLFSINNPPFLMAGEDAITIEYIMHLIDSSAELGINAGRYFNPIPGEIVSSKDSKTIAMYIYLTPSKGAKDINKQAIECPIYENTMDTILGLPLSAPTELTVKDQEVKEQFIKELQDYTPLLFDRVYSFKKIALQDIDDVEPFYAFATNRPRKEELNEAKIRFNDTWFDEIIPRRCMIDESTGVVTVIDDTNPILEINGNDKKTFTMKEWNTALSAYLKQHGGDYITKLTMNSPSIDSRVRIKLFGGKQTIGIFKWILLIILVVTVLVFVCYCIYHTCKHVKPPCQHSNHHDSSDPYSSPHGSTSI